MIPESRINQNKSSDVDDSEVVERVEVDDNEEVVVEDSTADVNVQAKLPPHGVYTIKWRAREKDGVYKSKTKKEPHRSYVAASLVGVIQDEEYEGTYVYENHINSLQQRGKLTSDLHHFLNVVGSPAPNRSTIGELEVFTSNVLDEEPVGMSEVDWKIGRKNADGTYTDLLTTMTKFPKKYQRSEDGSFVIQNGKKVWTGEYEQSIEDEETGETLNAQLYPKAHLTQAEATRLRQKLSAR